MTWFCVLGSGGMPSAPKKRKLDANEAAASIVSQIISETETPPAPTRDEISRVMADLGRRGGKRGGPARAEALSKKRRKQIASQAAKARWKASR